jgi:hypothetical protein
MQIIETTDSVINFVIAFTRRKADKKSKMIHFDSKSKYADQ